MWTSAKIGALADGRLFGANDLHFTECVIDSRNVTDGSFFVAIPGQKTDGHRYIRQAWTSGAVIVMASMERYKAEFCPERRPLGDRDLSDTVPPGKALILVPDALAALQKLAYMWLRELDPIVVAVTGSNGKTTTKDMIAAVLGAGYQVHKTPQNMNTEIGLPLSVLQAPPATEVMVLEMGMRGLKQIEQLCRICRPHIGVVTNIGSTHIELLGSQEAIAEAKWELITSLPPEGVAILNAEDAESVRMAEKRGMRCAKIFYGLEERYAAAQMRGSCLEPWQEMGTRFEAVCEVVGRRELLRRTADRPGTPEAAPDAGDTADCHCRGLRDRRQASEARISVNLPLPGAHNVLNALAALAVGRVLEVPLTAGAQALADLSLSNMRLELQPGIAGSRVINDAYNANPVSMKASLGVLRERSSGATIAVLGDMYELGDLSESGHYEVGAEAAVLDIGFLITVGPRAAGIARGALENGLPAERIARCETHEEALEQIHRALAQAPLGAWILVKASRGMRMEKLSSQIIEVCK